MWCRPYGNQQLASWWAESTYRVGDDKGFVADLLEGCAALAALRRRASQFCWPALCSRRRRLRSGAGRSLFPAITSTSKNLPWSVTNDERAGSYQTRDVQFWGFAGQTRNCGTTTARIRGRRAARPSDRFEGATGRSRHWAAPAGSARRAREKTRSWSRGIYISRLHPRRQNQTRAVLDPTWAVGAPPVGMMS